MCVFGFHSVHPSTGHRKSGQKPIMVLYIVGLGLGDEQDVTLRGLNVIKTAHKVFLENYTSILGVKLDKLVRMTAPPPKRS